MPLPTLLGLNGARLCSNPVELWLQSFYGSNPVSLDRRPMFRLHSFTREGELSSASTDRMCALACYLSIRPGM